VEESQDKLGYPVIHQAYKYIIFSFHILVFKKGRQTWSAKMAGFLSDAYFWVKAFHVMSVISWMAGLFYLPRLFVYHAERATQGSELDATLKIMERKLLRGIMHPAMVASWLFGLMLVFTPGAVGWDMIWPWTKAASLLAMTWFHFWLGARRVDFANDRNGLSGKTYRLMNEFPTVLMVVIILSVILKF
jgi:putative membrane protein